MEHVTGEGVENELDCVVCKGSASMPITLPSECPGAPLTEEQAARISWGELDYRDGRWTQLRPPVTAAAVKALCAGKHESEAIDTLSPEVQNLAWKRQEACRDYRVVRLDHLSDRPAKIGLTVWLPSQDAHRLNRVLDVTLLGGDDCFMVVRDVPRSDRLDLPRLVTGHFIDGELVRFARRHRLDIVELTEILGDGQWISSHKSAVPLVILDPPADAE